MNGRELASYSDGTNTITYKYNLDGIRTSKVVNGINTTYYLEGRTIIFEDRNGDVLYYIYNGSELLGFVYKNKTYYYHKNMFGDIISIIVIILLSSKAYYLNIDLFYYVRYNWFRKADIIKKK